MKKTFFLSIFIMIWHFTFSQILLTTSSKCDLKEMPDYASKSIVEIPAHRNLELWDYVNDEFFKVKMGGHIGYVHKIFIVYDAAYYLGKKIKDGNINEIYEMNRKNIDALNEKKVDEEKIWFASNVLASSSQLQTQSINQNTKVDNKQTLNSNTFSDREKETSNLSQDEYSGVWYSKETETGEYGNVFFINIVWQEDYYEIKEIGVLCNNYGGSIGWSCASSESGGYTPHNLSGIYTNINDGRLISDRGFGAVYITYLKEKEKLLINVYNKEMLHYRRSTVQMWKYIFENKFNWDGPYIDRTTMKNLPKTK